MKPIVQVQDWGIIDYKKAWSQQTDLHASLLQHKRSGTQPDFHGHLILCEHPPVFTLGKSGKEDHLLLSAEARRDAGIDYHKINRGGDITHHGPGQLVVYPIVDLEYWYRDVHRFVRAIEEVVIRALRDFDMDAMRIEDYTGVWMEVSPSHFEKICAIGVHLSRWVSMHGLALNVKNDLTYFDHIIPCGIQRKDMKVTSMKNILDETPDMELVKGRITGHFAEIFQCQLTELATLNK